MKRAMAFERVKGVPGLLYVPDDAGDEKKHRCADCHFCQWCSDERCKLCLGNKACAKKRRRAKR